MTDKPTMRRRVRSFRSLLAIGGAAAVTIGLAQAGGTLASPTPSVALDSQVEVGNFYPTPLPETISCTTDKNWSGTSQKAVVSWASAGPGLTYQVEIWQNNDNRREIHPVSGTSYTFSPSTTARDYRLSRFRSA